MNRIHVQGGRIKKRGSDRYFDGVTLREPGVGEGIRIARAVRIGMSKEEFTAANVRNASTLTRLRIRARNIRSAYERLWRCHVDCNRVLFLYDSKEGDCDENARIQELRDYIAQHLCVVEDIRAKVERSTRSKAAWKKCNKGGGSRRRVCLELDAAVVQELSRREEEETESACEPTAPIRSERSTPVVLYPKRYAADIARIQKELDAEDYGIKKPSRGEKLAAAGANAFERGDLTAVASVDVTIAQQQATFRAARIARRHAKLQWRLKCAIMRSRIALWIHSLMKNVRDQWY